MEKDIKYCRYCGKQIDADSTFCTHCGMSQSVTTIQDNKLSVFIKRLCDTCRNYFCKLKNVFRYRDSTVSKLKKLLKRIFIIFSILISIGLLVILGCWIYGLYLTYSWDKEDEYRETLAKTDITKADSLARLLFSEVANNDHYYKDFLNLCYNRCNKDHIEIGVEILRYAAEKGDANAQFKLGAIYAGAHYEWSSPAFHRKNTMLNEEIDNNRACYWYSLSAKQGNSTALLNLGLSYYEGSGVKKDLVKATECITKSAEMGHSTAQRVLGDMYRDGDVYIRIATDSISGESIIINIKPKIEIAKEWWQKAAAEGDLDAKERLEKIYE